MVKYIVKSVHRAENERTLWLGNDSHCNEVLNRLPPIATPERARRFDTMTEALVVGHDFRRTFKDGPNWNDLEYNGMFGKLVIEEVEV